MVSLEERRATGNKHILDLDKLKWHDDETFGSPRTTTGDDGKLSCHFGLASQVLERFPPEIICCARVGIITLDGNTGW
jgi:hypothetical protein